MTIYPKSRRRTAVVTRCAALFWTMSISFGIARGELGPPICKMTRRSIVLASDRRMDRTYTWVRGSALTGLFFSINIFVLAFSYDLGKRSYKIG